VSSRLQDALDRSLRNASPFTRSWEPHAAVVIAACLDGDIHFTVSDRSRLRRNLARSPRIAFTAADRSHALMGSRRRSLGSIYRIAIEWIFAS
jgi:hypothetical protein